MLEKGYGPIVLLADSQLLLSQLKGQKLIHWVAEKARAKAAARDTPTRPLQALYIGASNGNIPEFYEMAVEICKVWGIEKVINGTTEQQFHRVRPEDVDVVILAGGDVELGWSFISHKTIQAWLRDFSASNGVLIGISAGAIHLTSTFSITRQSSVEFLGFYSGGLVVHEEADNWPTALGWHQYLLSDKEGAFTGFSPIYCIPFGGGMVIEPRELEEPESGTPRPVGVGFFLSES